MLDAVFVGRVMTAKDDLRALCKAMVTRISVMQDRHDRERSLGKAHDAAMLQAHLDDLQYFKDEMVRIGKRL